MEDKDYYWLALALVPGVGRITFHRLLEKYGSPEKVFSASWEELSSFPLLRRESIEHIYRFKIKEKAEKEIEKAKKMGVSLVNLQNQQYPPNLKTIPDPPLILYIKGELVEEDRHSIAIVGTRHASTYGRSVTEKLSGELAARGVCIISGLARGIDTLAHRGALSAGGRTIAVMGCGLDEVYPRENRKLLREIEARGVVCSEFPFGTHPEPGNFPVRNRIISGLSLGTIVVEADERSGALITAKLALEQGREVFAVPGNITSRNSLGTNYLIKRGAKLVQQWEDVVEELPYPSREAIEKRATLAPEAAKSELPLTDSERAIYHLLSPDKPLHIDQLAESLGLDYNLLLSHLLSLEIKKKIVQLPGKLFIRKL
ncbi:DNA-protecting protein DprA [bacterium (candidate division B38) B3_B38]|nr:MAG: DNA-protecting protein DprA [bacterium (candidate division B38) B3_B38]